MKIKYAGICFIVCSIMVNAKQNFFRSFMFTRSAYMHIGMHNQLWHEIIYTKRGSVRGAFQITPFFQQSMPISKNDRYFLFKNKKKLVVAGDNQLTNTRVRDVRAEWLGLPSTFRGVFSVHPKQQQMGFIVEYNQDLCQFIDWEFAQDWQLSITLPFTMVEHNMQPRQQQVIDTNPVAGQPHDLLEAFNQERWLHAKIGGEKSKTALSCIKISLESSYLADNHFLIAYHSSFTAPIAPKASSEFLFSPLHATNGHFAIGAGVDFQILLNRYPQQGACCLFASLDSLFLIHSHQWRTFDLKRKPWSRYLLFNHIDGPPNQNIPGVNILTRKVQVRPYNLVDFAAGLRFETEHISLEVSYGVWGHAQEKIKKLSDCFPSIYGIATPQNPSDTQAATASQSTINQLAPADSTFVPIVEDDINLNSGQAGSAMNHSAHFAFGTKKLGRIKSCFIGGGIIVEVPQKNGALQSWQAYAKIGAAF